MMQKNVGNIDRFIRAVAGIVLIAWLVLTGFEGSIMNIAQLTVGVILIGTAVLSYCPPYALLGINTCKTKESS